MTRISALDVVDVRFPTSRDLDGSDAMNPEPDYSAAYVVLRTDDLAVSGCSLLFTTGRGNDVACAAIRSLTPYVVGLDVGTTVADVGALARVLTWDGQLRWLGPEKGVMHMAIGAVVNAFWDMRSRLDAQPLWRVLASLSPEDIVGQIDFTYIEDALSPTDALDDSPCLRGRPGGAQEGVGGRWVPRLHDVGGVVGVRRRKGRTAVARIDCRGVHHAEAESRRRHRVRHPAARRRSTGCRRRRTLAVDANQRWGVDEAIHWMTRLAPFDPYWIEEPTSPDDVLGHRTIRNALSPIRVATGEHVQNRVIFKQLLQAEAIDVVQIDACRVGGVNENLAILLLAAKFGVPVCPHAGGVGLCEMVQHLAMFDFVAVSGTFEGRWIEYIDHLHEHFTAPVRVEGGRYRAPSAPGGGAQLHDTSIAEHRFPDGPVWADSA